MEKKTQSLRISPQNEKFRGSNLVFIISVDITIFFPERNSEVVGVIFFNLHNVIHKGASNNIVRNKLG